MERESRKSQLTLIGLLCIALLILFGVVNFSKPKPDIRKEIGNLASSDYHLTRRAQLNIIRIGTNALPELNSALSTSANNQQKALIYSLIGCLDPTLYGKLILATRHHSASDIWVAFEFVDTDSLKKLPAEQLAEIVELFKTHYTNFSDKLDADATFESLKANFPQEFGDK